MASMQKKHIGSPDEQRTFPKGKLELVKAGHITFGRTTLEPGWKWSESVKPTSKTSSCQVSHTSYHISGRLRVRMDDGAEQEFGPGDVAVVPPGHDAWVVGKEPVVVLHIEVTG